MQLLRKSQQNMMITVFPPSDLPHFKITPHTYEYHEGGLHIHLGK